MPVAKRTGEVEDKLDVLINILHEQKERVPLLYEIADVENKLLITVIKSRCGVST